MGRIEGRANNVRPYKGGAVGAVLSGGGTPPLQRVIRWGWGLRKIKAALKMRVAFILCLGIAVIVIS